MRVVILGAGGHARVVIDVLRRQSLHEIVGLLDAARAGATVDGLPVLGGDERLPELRDSGVTHGLVGVGAVKDPQLRVRLYERLRTAGFTAVTAVHPAAIVAAGVAIGAGTAVMAGAVINPGASVGENVIINTGAIVEHDCSIAAHAHVSPGAVLCGAVRVGAAAHVGAGSTVREGVTIGEGATVGAGAVVVADVDPWTLVVGVPARSRERGREVVV